MSISVPTTLFQANDGGSAFTTSSLSTVNFTTVSNTFLVAFVSLVGVSGSTSWTNTTATGLSFATTNLTWSNRIGYASPTSLQSMIAVATANVVTGSAAANITISNITNTGSTGMSYIIQVLSFTGANWTTPIGATAANVGLTINGAATSTLSPSPSTTSCVIGARATGYSGSGGAANASVGWTVLYNTVGQNGWNGLETQYINNYSSNSVSWQQTILGDSVYGTTEILLGFEVVADAGPIGNPGVMIGL